MQGGKKGLFENSTNLCNGTHKAEANFTGQNGKELRQDAELVATRLQGQGQASTSAGLTSDEKTGGGPGHWWWRLACASLARATRDPRGQPRITVLSQVLPYKLPRTGPPR